MNETVSTGSWYLLTIRNTRPNFNYMLSEILHQLRDYKTQTTETPKKKNTKQSRRLLTKV